MQFNPFRLNVAKALVSTATATAAGTSPRETRITDCDSYLWLGNKLALPAELLENTTLSS